MAAGKNRPSWRASLIRYPRTNPKPPTGGLVFGSLPDEYQCNGIARSTNQRCRCAALQGARFCRLHGGYRHAVPRQREAIGQHFESIAALRKGRQMLAAIGAQNPGMNPSIIERGMHASLVSFTDEENPDAE